MVCDDAVPTGAVSDVGRSRGAMHAVGRAVAHRADSACRRGPDFNTPEKNTPEKRAHGNTDIDPVSTVVGQQPASRVRAAPGPGRAGMGIGMGIGIDPVLYEACLAQLAVTRKGERLRCDPRCANAGKTPLQAKRLRQSAVLVSARFLDLATRSP